MRNSGPRLKILLIWPENTRKWSNIRVARWLCQQKTLNLKIGRRFTLSFVPKSQNPTKCLVKGGRKEPIIMKISKSPPAPSFIDSGLPPSKEKAFTIGTSDKIEPSGTTSSTDTTPDKTNYERSGDQIMTGSLVSLSEP